MVDLDTQITELLNKLKTLLEQITWLRQQAEELDRGLAEVQRDYDQKLGPLNAEADRLEALKLSLRARLSRRPHSTPQPSKPDDTPVPPKPIITADPVHPLPSPPLQKDPRVKRKRDLADYIGYFIADEARETVMQVINAILVDEQRDVGDMLELLTWGDIWTARADWETSAEQYKRLTDWSQVLTERLTYWHERIRGLERSSYYSLWQQKQSCSLAEWLANLDEMGRQQATNNEKLSREVAFLEQQLARQATGEVKND
jgi:hypothetical protein